MTDTLFADDDDAATPLTPEEREGLIPTYITLRRELNEAEQIGIADADRWAFSRKRDVLDEAFLRSLHKRMFGKVWRWAGQYRTTARNIGVDAYRIGVELHQLLGDVRYWIENATYSPMKSSRVFTIGWCSSIRFPTAMDATPDLPLTCLPCSLASRVSHGAG